METLTRSRGVRAFKLTDDFALEAFRAAQSLSSAMDDSLAREIRRAAVRCGAALVAASASDPGSSAIR